VITVDYATMNQPGNIKITQQLTLGPTGLCVPGQRNECKCSTYA